MTNILLINGHQPYPGSPGKLNAAYTARARAFFGRAGMAVRETASAGTWEVEAEIAKQLWADVIVLQFPLNSMSVPWSLKRYLDLVYTAGMDGRLARGDGRTRSDPSKQYGTGGKMGDTRYMLSVTANAPREAFDDPSQTLFAGRSLDELLAPVHINFAFFGLRPMMSFAAHDVAKAPRIEEDFARFDAHLKESFS